MTTGEVSTSMINIFVTDSITKYHEHLQIWLYRVVMNLSTNNFVVDLFVFGKKNADGFIKKDYKLSDSNFDPCGLTHI